MNPYRAFFTRLTAVIIPVLMTVLMAVSSVCAAQEQAWPEAPELVGESVVLMEANTQAVIYEKNAGEKKYPASTTKILTAIVVLENCTLDETVVFTEECCNLEEGAVTIDSVPGEKMPLKDVMYGLLLPSGNDCAMALALHVAGSVSAFVDMMNAKAVEIGALSSHFVNPSGLFNSNHYTTAEDMAAIARYAFHNSTFVDIISHQNYIIEPTNMTSESRVLVNTHEMITPGNPDYDSNVIGGKTGYLYESGRCLVTYGEKDGVTLLAVILDGPYYGIFHETKELLQFGWENFRIINVSEQERRFSFAEEDAKVQLDSSNQILMLNNVPFYELTSKINYAYYLDEAEYARAKLDAGITEGDPRQLYAWIDYYYDGHYLGKCNVFVDPAMEIPQVSFINVVYVNIWLILLIIAVVIVIVILLVRLGRKSKTGESKLSAREHRKSGRKQVRYYNRSDSIDLRDQYIKSGKKDKETIHGLNNISIPYSRRNRTADGEEPYREGPGRDVQRRDTLGRDNSGRDAQGKATLDIEELFETKSPETNTDMIQRSKAKEASDTTIIGNMEPTADNAVKRSERVAGSMRSGSRSSRVATSMRSGSKNRRPAGSSVQRDKK